MRSYLRAVIHGVDAAEGQVPAKEDKIAVVAGADASPEPVQGGNVIRAIMIDDSLCLLHGLRSADADTSPAPARTFAHAHVSSQAIVTVGVMK